MESNSAVQNLNTIRTLMERVAVYRRALAPIMVVDGAVGLAAAAAGLYFNVRTTKSFIELWTGAAIIAIALAFLLARRQAMHDQEPFWSPPTRRVALALLPPLAAGLLLATNFLVHDGTDMLQLTSIVWILCYGFALHSAGFFMPRGIRLFGCFFIVGACTVANGLFTGWFPERLDSHWIMGFFFGFLHVAYGIYLYLTEARKIAE